MNVKKYTETLEQVASLELQAVKAPGAAIAIITGDEVIFAQGFGRANSETGDPVTSDMLFRIGSLTKMITAYTLLSLVHEQHLNLHAPIAEYVPDLPPQLALLTIHQILSHTAGLKDDDSDYGSHDESALGYAVRHYNQRHFFCKPNTLFSYSGLGYAVAGVVIEAIGKNSYAQVVADRVLTPLQMQRSTFSPLEAMTYPFSQGHTVNATHGWSVVRPYDENTTRWPAGFLFSNVLELARFCIAFMNDGRIDGKSVLSPEVISVLSQPYARPLDEPDGRFYGYGLYLGEFAGMRSFEHSGGRKGFCSFLQMFPDQRFAVIELVNQANILLKKTQATAIDLILVPKRVPPAMSSPDLILTKKEQASLTGRYVSPDIYATEASDIIVFRTENHLMIQIGENGQPLPVIRRSETRFSAIQGENLPPIEFVFWKGLNKHEIYLCWANRAYKRIQQHH